MILLRGTQYADRREAAQRLSENLAGYRSQHPVVLGIPRGGVVVADALARELQADLDLVLTRKLGAPGNPELAIGAVAENGEAYLQGHIARKVGADDRYIEQERTRQFEEIRARRERYRTLMPRVSLRERTVILTDDGIATGATMQASIWAAREEEPSLIVVAVPVGSRDAIERLDREADEVICPYVPEYFYAIGQFYTDFSQVSDEEVLEILRAHSHKND
jgi:predicted phosphoribosyltransferase